MICKVIIELHISHACRAARIIPYGNKEWAEKHGYKQGDALSCANNKLIIEDDGFRHTLLELQENNFFENKNAGLNTWHKVFQNGWISFGDKKLKIDKLEISYIKPKNSKQIIKVDISQHILAFQEYITGDSNKFLILKDGTKMEI